MPSLGCSTLSSAHRFVGRPPFGVENRRPVAVGRAAPGGSLNLSHTSIFRRGVPATASATPDAILDVRPTRLPRWEGIRCGLALIGRPAWRRSGEVSRLAYASRSELHTRSELRLSRISTVGDKNPTFFPSKKLIAIPAAVANESIVLASCAEAAWGVGYRMLRQEKSREGG